jgi:hypothetical protein
LTINSEQLQHSACEKLLGIKIDSNLNWKNQIDKVCSKISSKIYLLSKIKKYLNLESRQLFYSGYILPLIDYCCVVWGNCSNEGLNRIFKLKKRTARLILDQDPIAPSEPLFKQLRWMSIEQRIKYHKYLLVSKCLKNEAPIYLKNKIQYLSDRNPYSLRDVVIEKLQIPKAKTELFKKTFTYSGPKLCNELSFSIRQASSHNAFKTKVKNLILNDDVQKCTLIYH